jgi:hypothetical protein
VISCTPDPDLAVIVIKHEHLEGSGVKLLEYKEVSYLQVMCFEKL